MYWSGSKDIKDLLARVLRQKQTELKGKVVIDMPAGNGLTSAMLFDFGSEVLAFDLFPEFFQFQKVECRAVDLSDVLPLPDQTADWIIFQEGIEHLPDHLKILKECQRVLKPGGRMILTTPNSSNLRSKLAHLLLEAETMKVMPPNEEDSVWAAEGGRVYFGHLFSIGLQRLRTLARVAGLELVEVHPARVNWSSFYIWLLVYPWIRFKLSSVLRRSLRKKNLSQVPLAYAEAKRWLLDQNVLCSGHLILEFRKIADASLPISHAAKAELREYVT